MKHNDRLDAIITSALRPYGLAAQPAAKLTLFLDFSLLLGWYTSVLTMEMRAHVDAVMSVWRSEGVSSGQTYRFPLPWFPQRLDVFYSNIPEDLVEVLMTYLTYARITHHHAPSFRAELGQLDTKVCTAYICAFAYLAETYGRALQEKQWWQVVEEEEFAEYLTYLCGVANDCQRMRGKDIMGLAR